MEGGHNGRTRLLDNCIGKRKRIRRKAVDNDADLRKVAVDCSGVSIDNHSGGLELASGESQ